MYQTNVFSKYIIFVLKFRSCPGWDLIPRTPLDVRSFRAVNFQRFRSSCARSTPLQNRSPNDYGSTRWSSCVSSGVCAKTTTDPDGVNLVFSHRSFLFFFLILRRQENDNRRVKISVFRRYLYWQYVSQRAFLVPRTKPFPIVRRAVKLVFSDMFIIFYTRYAQTHTHTQNCIENIGREDDISRKRVSAETRVRATSGCVGRLS